MTWERSSQELITAQNEDDDDDQNGTTTQNNNTYGGDDGTAKRNKTMSWQEYQSKTRLA